MRGRVFVALLLAAVLLSCAPRSVRADDDNEDDGSVQLVPGQSVATAAAVPESMRSWVYMLCALKFEEDAVPASKEDPDVPATGVEEEDAAAEEAEEGDDATTEQHGSDKKKSGKKQGVLSKLMKNVKKKMKKITKWFKADGAKKMNHAIGADLSVAECVRLGELLGNQREMIDDALLKPLPTNEQANKAEEAGEGGAAEAELEEEEGDGPVEREEQQNEDGDGEFLETGAEIGPFHITKKWKRRTIPFYFATDEPGAALDFATRLNFLRGAAMLASGSSIVLVPMDPSSKHMKLRISEKVNACFTVVGKQKNKQTRKTHEQTINFGKSCGPGNAAHEVLHSLGFRHEQSRGDRDFYIKYEPRNAIPRMIHNFDKVETDGKKVVLPSKRFDYASIMLYGAYSFTRNGRPTIAKRAIDDPEGWKAKGERRPRGLHTEPGQRDKLSIGDQRILAEYYPSITPKTVAPGEETAMDDALNHDADDCIRASKFPFCAVWNECEHELSVSVTLKSTKHRRHKYQNGDFVTLAPRSALRLDPDIQRCAYGVKIKWRMGHFKPKHGRVVVDFVEQRF